jgi:NADPH2:quinone reductase
MKRMVVHQVGGPEVMQLEEAPMPEPGPGQARIRIEAIGVNFIDIYHRTGQYKLPLPLVPGTEAAGTVDAVGEGVTAFRPGDRVAYGLVNGAYADYTIVPADRLLPLPAGVDAKLAAAVVVQGLTAHYLSHDTFPLQPGQTALVHAAAGGTGALLVQMAKMRGARVIGTVSTEQKAQIAREAGADDIILYTQQDFERETKRLTDGRGVDVVYDSVGKDTFDKSLNVLRPRGYLVLCGQSSGAVPPFDPQVLNAKGSLYLTRPTMGHYVQTRDELLRRANDVFGWIASGKLTVRIDRTYPLAEAAAAQEALAGRHTQGKVLLIP